MKARDEHELHERLRVLVASHFLAEVEAEFSRAFRVTYDVPLNFASIEEARFDSILLSLDTRVSVDAIDAFPDSIGAIATYSVGTDHIDLEAAERRGIAVFNTPGVLSDSVAENAIFLMLGAARRATECIDLIRGHAWTGWNPTQIVGVELSGRRLGILGLGDIGRRIATRAQALGMEILYHNRSRVQGDEVNGLGYRESGEELVADSDVLLIACPSTAETRGMINAELLMHARPGLIVVNIARGDIVDDAALIAALREGRVWAAGLDVFAGEPDVHPDYFGLPNVFMLPHVGSSTIEARLRMGRILITALESWHTGGDPENRVC